MGGSLIRIKIMLFNLIYLKICWQDRIESNYVSHSDGLVHWFRLVTWQALFPIHEGLSRGTNKALFSSRRPVHWSPGKQKRISNMKEEENIFLWLYCFVPWSRRKKHISQFLKVIFSDQVENQLGTYSPDVCLVVVAVDDWATMDQVILHWDP